MKKPRDKYKKEIKSYQTFSIKNHKITNNINMQHKSTNWQANPC
jgi:hypothetical protein